ncbi:glucose-6-phosphate 1-dehydrogenase [Planctomycetaceae bacterium SCGC AG-212-D15]|nr:glucose-6-phosphate 1-dehydrogenase [Planctomycetaceae bacterium SCGC AG-212-D15]
MPTNVQTRGPAPKNGTKRGDPCLLVLFGASGDLTKRLLMPALYNLACDSLLPEQFAILGIALDELSSEEFRSRLSSEIKQFATRTFDEAVWDDFAKRLHYMSANFSDAKAYERLPGLIQKLDQEFHIGGNVLFYLAVPPAVFSLVSEQLGKAGLAKPAGNAWTRLIIEKPFGHDLASAIELNRAILTYWKEDQLYRIDHYLGKETVQNLLAFRFSNGIFEPLWNRRYINHIEFSVTEMVGVEQRGGYYDKTGVLRDMIQNHMFQMLAYLCMEPPSSFRPDAIRNEKAKLLEAVRVMKPEEVPVNTVRGQYGPGRKADGSPALGYRQEPNVNPNSRTETFAALKLMIDNWRWDGVPVYLRSGKNLWKRGTEIVVQFKKAPEVVFRDSPDVHRLDSNLLIFHMQPDQGIEFRFHAKTPGMKMHLQTVNMRFDYRELFEAQRGTGYEILLYNVMIGDATLFSRTDLIESAWRVAQPLLDVWSAPSSDAIPTYPAGSWGPRAAYDLMERDGREWVEIINRNVLEKVPLFAGADPVFLNNLAVMLHPAAYSAGEVIVQHGESSGEMYIICRGQVEVLDASGKRVNTQSEGDFFGEMGLLLSKPRTATVRALTECDLFVLEKEEFLRFLTDQPAFAAKVGEVARQRYRIVEELLPK